MVIEQRYRNADCVVQKGLEMFKALRYLVGWYVRDCNRKEGFAKTVFEIDPRLYGLGEQWEGRTIKVTIESVKEPYAEWAMITKKSR